MTIHPELRSYACDPSKLDELWDAMAVELNEYGAGPKKTGKEWRKSMRSWKNQTRSQARAIERENLTGGRASTNKLRDYQERALRLWDPEIEDGLYFRIFANVCIIYSN